MKIDERQNHQ